MKVNLIYISSPGQWIWNFIEIPGKKSRLFSKIMGQNTIILKAKIILFIRKDMRKEAENNFFLLLLYHHLLLLGILWMHIVTT